MSIAIKKFTFVSLLLCVAASSAALAECEGTMGGESTRKSRNAPLSLAEQFARHYTRVEPMTENLREIADLTSTEMQEEAWVDANRAKVQDAIKAAGLAKTIDASGPGLTFHNAAMIDHLAILQAHILKRLAIFHEELETTGSPQLAYLKGAARAPIQNSLPDLNERKKHWQEYYDDLMASPRFPQVFKQSLSLCQRTYAEHEIEEDSDYIAYVRLLAHLHANQFVYNPDPANN